MPACRIKRATSVLKVLTFTVNSVYLRRFFRNFSSKKYQKISQVSQNKDSHTAHAAFEETSFTQFPSPQLIVVLESANFLYI